MGTAFEIWSLIYSFLLKGIFVSVIIILVAKSVFKNRINIEISLNVIRIILIIHSAVYIILFIASLLNNSADNSLWPRAFGPYWWAYWLMMIFNSLLPLTLLIKRLNNRNSYLLLVSILMNVGWIFESFVIHMTNIERDYPGNNFNPYLPTPTEISVLVKGFIVGIFILVVGNLTKMIGKQKLIKGQ